MQRRQRADQGLCHLHGLGGGQRTLAQHLGQAFVARLQQGVRQGHAVKGGLPHRADLDQVLLLDRGDLLPALQHLVFIEMRFGQANDRVRVSFAVRLEERAATLRAQQRLQVVIPGNCPAFVFGPKIHQAQPRLAVLKQRECRRPWARPSSIVKETERAHRWQKLLRNR